MKDGGQWLLLFHLEQKATSEFERALVFCLRPNVGNTHETIAWFHGSFALLLSRLFSGNASNPKRSQQRGLRKWDGIKQRLLI